MTMLAGVMMAGVACGDPSGPDVTPITGLPRALTAAEADVIEGSNAFAFGLLREMRAFRPDSANTFLSPLSASMALGMTLNGADGETWTQMRDALGFQGLDEQAVNEAYRSLIALLLELDPAVEFGLGNAIWVDEIALLPGFVDRAETYFGAVVDALDFDDPASADVMNAWVDSVTKGRIRRLVETVDPDALLYLVNAIYFNADWRATFDEDATYRAPFTRADGSRVTVDMMSDEVGYRTLNAGNPDAVQGVELPYGGGAYTAVAMLPPADRSIDAFVAGLDDGTWRAWMEHFDEAARNEDLDDEGLLVQLPKFELEWGDSLGPALQALGMTDAFDDQRADFTRLTDDREDLFIYDVQQKTYVRVDEEGTEAAAATSVTVGPTSAPPSVTFDRPFLFAIRERYSGTVLFLGVIGDPSA
jgi:serine protease inhibitor